MISTVLSFMGYYAGRTAADWLSKATQWAVQGGHYSNVVDCCYNAARATLGNNASWEQIQSYAQTLIHSLVH